jgi:histidinol phosphatase-like enzyme (inositol monophosphatase family)
VTANLLDACEELARLTGDVALRHFTRDVHVRVKSDGSPVTPGDTEAESAAREWLARRFPADGIVGEEFGERDVTAARRWIVDPIDGTKSFVRGVPLWGTLVALMEGRAVLAGAAYFPAVDELVVAAPSQGCWHNGARTRVSAVPTLAESLVLTTDARCAGIDERRRAWQRLAAGAALSRTWGDAYGYLLVATGRAELMCDPVTQIWDAACMVPIIREAGGTVTDWDGTPALPSQSLVATNEAIARESRAILRANTTHD